MLSNNIMYILMALILTMCSAIYFSTTAQQEKTEKTCYKPVINATNNKCSSIKAYPIQTAQQGWVSWLTGNSRSSQFHYLDLLELLESVGNDTHTAVSKQAR
jgi:hypothetical protein